MRNSDYARAVVLGAVLGMSSLTLIYMMGVALDTKPQPTKPPSKFEVVDHYKDCDLLRWADGHLAEYKYVLYCPNK